MRKRNEDRTTKYMILLCLLVFVGILCTSWTYAAYTNFSSARRVVSVRAGERVLFSSNLLSVENSVTDPMLYQSKRIVLTTAENGETYFVVEIYNYDPGDVTVFNENDITYTLRVTVDSETYEDYDINNNNVTFHEQNGEYIGEISGQKLKGGELSKHSFTIRVAEADKDRLSVRVEAIPDTESYKVTSQKKLAAIITAGELEVRKDWKGKFLDDQTREPNAYDGFNYEISGNGKGTLTLSWDPVYLTINPWFPAEVGLSQENITDDVNHTGFKCISFSVNDNQTAFQTQFYKADRWNSQIGWSAVTGGLESKVIVTYTE